MVKRRFFKKVDLRRKPMSLQSDDILIGYYEYIQNWRNSYLGAASEYHKRYGGWGKYPW